MRCLPILMGIVMALSTVAAQAQEVVSFISCPIYRDTDAGRKSGCWLADDPASGIRYDVTPSPTKPLLGQEVLVEGIVAAGGEECGGVVLEPVRVSVLPGACTEAMLPAEDYPGRPYSLPPRNVRPMGVEREIDRPLDEETTFYLFFDLNRDFFTYQLNDYFFDRAHAFIRKAAPRKIIVTGYAATGAFEVSGRRLAESAGIAEARARKTTRALVMLGVPEEIIETRWVDAAKPVDVVDADGLPQASRRRVEILVQP